MPLPKPTPAEDKQHFVSRCIEKVMSEGKYEVDQASAMCYAQWDTESYSAKREKRISRLKQLVERRNKKLYGDNN